MRLARPLRGRFPKAFVFCLPFAAGPSQGLPGILPCFVARVRAGGEVLEQPWKTRRLTQNVMLSDRNMYFSTEGRQQDTGGLKRVHISGTKATQLREFEKANRVRESQQQTKHVANQFLSIFRFCFWSSAPCTYAPGTSNDSVQELHAIRRSTILVASHAPESGEVRRGGGEPTSPKTDRRHM